MDVMSTNPNEPNSPDVKDLQGIPAPLPQEPADPAPARRLINPGNPAALAKGRASQAKRVAEADQRLLKLIDEEVRQGNVTDPEWTTQAYKSLGKKMGRSRIGLLKQLQRIGVRGGLEGVRRKHAGLPQVEEGDGLTPTEVAAEVHGWTILDLFDRLMAKFNLVEEEKDEDEPAEEEGDPRRTWIAWRVFLAALFALPQEAVAKDHCPAEERGDLPEEVPDYPGVVDTSIPRGAGHPDQGASAQELFAACTGRATWPTVQAKLVSLIVGRRGGKSYITAIIGIYLACCCKYRLKLGTRGMVMILARDKEQAGVIREYILAFLKALPQLQLNFADDPTQKLIELKNGITIEVRAAGEAGTRGYTVVAALADEIAFWPTDPDSAKQDKKVLRALRPSMLGIKNSMIVMLSSPYAQRGELYENHRKFYGKDDQTRNLVWQADTLTMRPSDDPDLLNEIREEYADDPESAKAEYGAQFRSDLENIYSKAALQAVSVDARIEQPYRSGVRYRAFVDPSGGSSDSYVLAIAHDEERTIGTEKVKIPVLDKVKEWQPKFDPEEVSKDVVAICKDYHITSVTGDAYGGEWPRDPLKKRGINYELSEMNRSELYLTFLPVVNSGRVELLDMEHHRRALNQFANLERRVGRSGKDSVDHPPGGHDDVSNAIAGVIVGAKSKSAVMGAVW